MTEVKGRAKGGVARARSLTAERKREIAMKGVAAKKEKASLPKAICGSEDRKITIGDIEIQCYVLEDETRVLTLRSFQSGIGMSEGGGKGGVRKIPALMGRLKDKGVEIKELDVRANAPLRFVTPAGNVADGYDARILPDVCAVIIEADRRRILDKRYAHLAERASTLQHGFATLGIIWLVDKVTGYEGLKKANDIASIIEAFVVKEMRPYVRKFPPEYYEQICRLRKVPYDPTSVKRPAYFGHLTNNIIYHRLAPFVWKELKNKSAKDSKKTKLHLHRFLTEEIGDPRLREVITTNITVMKLSDDWFDFLSKLDRVLPRYNKTMQLPLKEAALENDNGVGL